MTSVLRRYAQLDPRTQYFYTAGTNGYVDSSSNSITVSSLMTINDLSASFVSAIVLPAGLLKDLGRSITVYDPANNNAHIAIFRQVMVVNGKNVEGISGIPISPANTAPPFTPNTTITYICTWVDSPTRTAPFVLADVARTG